MASLLKRLVKLNTYVYKTGYTFVELCLAYLYPKKEMRILFSKKNDFMERDIRKTLHYLPHTLTFGEINEQSIAENDLIIPLLIEDVLYLDQVRHLIKDNPIPIPSKESVLLCDDKFIFAQKMTEFGYGDYIPQINGDLPYPFFLKKKIDCGGENSFLVENHEQELDILKNISNLDDYFRQKFVSGTSEYSTHIYFNHQRIVRSITLEYMFEKDGSISGKDEKFGVKMHHSCPYLDLFTNILNSMNYEGICCFNYKVIDKKPNIFEINPRFGGNLALYFFSFIRSLD
jgi:hypothetical protein